MELEAEDIIRKLVRWCHL